MKLFFLILYRLSGWKTETNVLKEQNIKKAVIIVAGHTSNWDFIRGMGSIKDLQINPRFTIKKEWMVFPFSWIFNKLGAIPIDRTPNIDGTRPSAVDQMVEILNNNDEICIVVTPEGTRKRREKWKSGFYHVAYKAKVPIVCGYIDYKKKTTGLTNLVMPTGNYEEDMKKINDFYSTIHPKHPEKFSLNIT